MGSTAGWQPATLTILYKFKKQDFFSLGRHLGPLEKSGLVWLPSSVFRIRIRLNTYPDPDPPKISMQIRMGDLNGN
jgi:hypothetical protein